MNWTDTELCRIAQKWHTDKCRFHDYTPYYHSLLGAKRNEVKKVLEIGLGWAGLMHQDYQRAGSLLMWQDYFPNAEIYGLDIRPETLRTEGRIKSFLCDQSSIASLRQIATELGGDFDLIVDDGSHVPEHQVLTASVFVPLLARDGIYVIEDVHTDYFRPGTGDHIHERDGSITELEYVRTRLPFPHEIIDIPNEVIGPERLILIRAQKGRPYLRRTVVNVSSGIYYRRGQARLGRSLAEFDPLTERKFWSDMPADWPKHRDKPYAFKSFAMAKAFETSDMVLWADSLITAIAPMAPLWERIERDGYFLAHGGLFNYEWTADSAYADLFPDMPIEKAREVNRTIPQIVGGIIGVNQRSNIGAEFFREYHRLAVATNAFAGPWANLDCPNRPVYGEGSDYATASCGPPDVKGHRHDQTAASVVAWRLGMKLAAYPAPYAYTTAGKGTILLHDGPGMENEPPLPPDPPRQTGPMCSVCGSRAIGIAGGMRRCNQCGAAWA